MEKRQAAIEEWVAEYPYLDEIAKLQQLVLTVLSEYPTGKKDLESMVKDETKIKEHYQEKLPALEQNLLNEKFFKNSGEILGHLVAAFSRSDLPGAFIEQSKALEGLLKTRPTAASDLIKAMLGEQNELSPELKEGQINSGMASFFVWNILAETLKPLRTHLEDLQREKEWNKPHCPLCGQLPAMAQLIRTEKGRERELSCSLCHTKWKYKRIGCPYCGNEDQESLSIIELTEAPEFRLDTCNQCKGYLKTYLDEGNEEIALNDWSTLHLDVIGKKEGFQRKDYQLYKI